eukprot:183320-Rhodomonas_salina.2
MSVGSHRDNPEFLAMSEREINSYKQQKAYKVYWKTGARKDVSKQYCLPAAVQWPSSRMLRGGP